MLQRRKYHKNLKTPEVSKDEGTDCVDRISNLPVEIIRIILKSVPLQDAAKTSVLSRRWRTIWDSRPDIYLDECDFGVEYYSLYTSKSNIAKREAFLTYLEKFLDKYSEYNDCAVNCLYLRMTLVKNPSSELLVKKIGDFISKSKVKKLHLRIQTPDHQGFDFPIIAPFANTLGILECEVSSYWSFVLPNLRTLYLFNVCIEDDAFKSLIAACHKIEFLYIVIGSKLFTIAVSNPTLKFLELNLEGFDGKIQIESKNLKSLKLTGLLDDKCELQVTATTSVKSLTLDHVGWQGRTLMHFISKFPLLEKLVIHRWNDEYEIEEIRIDAPKLKFLDYTGGLTSFRGIKASQELETVKFHLKPQRRDAGWYVRLRNSLESFAHSKHLSLICQNEQLLLTIQIFGCKTIVLTFDGCHDIIFPDELTEILRPAINDLKNLDLQIASSTATSQQILDGFVWILPGLKTLKLTLGSISKLIEFPQRE